ncbi:Gustatory receptor 67a [Halyomorpha halys]|nr:Gustatory receptor 67a [Halyomorpha halys]
MTSRPLTRAIISNMTFRVSSLLGMFPFRAVRNDLKVDKVSLLYSFIFQIFITIVYPYFGTKFLSKLEIENNKGLHNGESFNHIISIIFFLTHTVIFPCLISCLYYQRNAFLKSVHVLDNLEDIFHQTEFQFRMGSTQMMNLFEILFPILCCTIFFIQGNTMGNINVTIGFSAVPLQMALGCCQFNFFVDTITNFLQSSSKFLVQIKPPVPFWKLRTLNNVVDAANQLVSTSIEINKIYSLQLLTTVAVGYFSVISHLYYTYLNSRSNDELNYRLAVGDTVMVLFYVFVLVRLINSPAQAYYKSKEFNTLLYQLMIEDMTNEFIHNEKLKLHIAMKREVVFSVCGFFNLDYTLLHSMIASAATYLVILIQFGDPAS